MTRRQYARRQSRRALIWRVFYGSLSPALISTWSTRTSDRFPVLLDRPARLLLKVDKSFPLAILSRR